MDRVASVVVGAALILGSSLLLATLSYLRYLAHETGAGSRLPALNHLARKILVAAAVAISVGILMKTILRLS